jgi:putative membrane protein
MSPSDRTPNDDAHPERRRPRAFRVDGPDVVVAPAGEAGAEPPRFTRARQTVIVTEPEEPTEPIGAVPVPVAGARGGLWRKLLFGALGGLVSLAVGLSIDGLIRELWARAEWLGWLGLALAGVALAALIAIIAREVAGFARLARIDRLRRKVATAILGDDEKAARGLVGELATLYADRAETARGRAALRGHAREVIEGADLLKLAERELLLPLDETARRLVLDAAKRVSVVTAISPRAAVDILYVLYENIRLLRRLADLYGGRPGTLGFLSLAGRVVTHLGVTGGMALGDTLVQQLVGQGLAAKLSARLGEGVVNGLLTARLGLAALDVVRPMPWTAVPPPKLRDMMGEITKMPSTD